jgi:two-component system, cell cycle sensor histidine kinase and response regulator CckA
VRQEAPAPTTPAVDLGALAIAASPDGVVVVDAGGTVLHANRAAERMLASRHLPTGEGDGVDPASDGDERENSGTPAGVVGRDFGSLLGIDAEIVEGVVSLPRKGGLALHLELRTATARAAGGASLRVVTLRDVSPEGGRAQAGRARAPGSAEEQDRLLAIVDATPSAVAMVDPRERLTFLNAAGRRMLGFGPGEAVTGPTLSELHPPEAYAALREVALPAARERGAWSGETHLLGRDGTAIPVWQTILAHRSPDGELQYYSAVARDLSAWKRTEEALVERVKELRTLYGVSRELARSAVPLTERLERVASLLPPGWLYPEITVARIAWGEVVFATAGFRETRWMLASEFRSQGEVVGRVEVALLEERPDRPGGEGPFLPEERELIDAVATAVGEAIERDRLQNEFIQGQKLETIGRLAGSVAHDFNNLLMVIQGHAEIALETLPSSVPLTDDLARILDASRRGGDLTRQLLAFSRRQALQERFLHLRDQVERLEPMLRSLVPERIELRFHTGGEPGPVRADPVKLDQVVLNLIVNAVDAIETRGTIDLRLGGRTLGRREAAAIPWRVRPGEYVSLRIRDTGSGMDPEVLERIFEPFFTTKAEGRGTGLGLSVVFGIVKQSGGHLFVESGPGEGTDVEILLPRAEAEEGEQALGMGAASEARGAGSGPAAVPEEAARRALTGRAPPVPADESGTGDRRGAVILLVEDDRSVRDVMGRILEREGHRVLFAADGRAALEIVDARGSEIDLVVSDVVMPVMGGVEFVEVLWRTRPELQVVLVSGYSERELTAGIRDRVAGFLEKPFSPRAVAEVIRRALE